MTASIATELRKLTTVRTTWTLSTIGLVIVAMSTSSYVFGDPVDAAVGSATRTATAIDVIGANSLMVLVVGVLVMTTEFRHDTIGHTLQLTPGRTRVLASKLVAGAVYGAAFFAACLAITAVMLLATVVTSGTSPAFGGSIIDALWRNLLAMSLTGALGVAAGAVIRSQVVAVTTSLLWVFVVENLVSATSYAVGRWLPFQALNAIHVSELERAGQGGGILPLTPTTGLLVFLGHVALLSLIAGVTMSERDI